MVNKAIVVGNLGGDPTSGQTQSGTKWCRFRMATTKKRKDKASGLMREFTQWHSIATWGDVAGLCAQYLKKGSKVYVEGELQTRKWRDKNEIERETTEIVVQGFDGQILFCDKREGTGHAPDPDAEPDGYVPREPSHSDTRDWQRP